MKSGHVVQRARQRAEHSDYIVQLLVSHAAMVATALMGMRETTLACAFRTIQVNVKF